MYAPLYSQIYSITRLHTPRICRAKGGILQEMVVVDCEQAVSEDVFTLDNDWRDRSAQFLKKASDHATADVFAEWRHSTKGTCHVSRNHSLSNRSGRLCGKVCGGWEWPLRRAFRPR